MPPIMRSGSVCTAAGKRLHARRDGQDVSGHLIQQFFVTTREMRFVRMTNLQLRVHWYK